MDWVDVLVILVILQGTWTLFAMYRFSHCWWRWPMTIANIVIYLGLLLLVMQWQPSPVAN